MCERSERRQPDLEHDQEDAGSPPLHNGRTPRRPETTLSPASGALTGLDDVRAPLGEPPGASPRLRRRDLLAWGGATAMLPAFPSLLRAQASESAGDDVLRPMSVGYVEGSDGWRAFRRIGAGALNRGIRAEAGRPPEPASVVPAQSLIAGDQSAANELVRVRVHGLYPIPNPTHVRNAYLTVYFPSPEHGRNVLLPFTAWGYKSRPAPDPAPPLSFVAPLGADGALDMLLEVKGAPNNALARRPSLVSPAPGPVGGRFATSFTVDWFAGRPKLQRGVYLLGFAADSWSAARTLPTAKAGGKRPVELVSLMVSFEPIQPR